MSQSSDLPPTNSGARLPWLTWKYSLIFLIALLALVGTLAFSQFLADTGDDSNNPPTLVALNESTSTAPEVTQSTVSGNPTDVPTASVRVPTVAASNEPTVAATPSPTGLRVEGMISDADGKPIQGARITDGMQVLVTGGDGLFDIEIASELEDSHLLVSASGYGDWTAPISSLSGRQDIAMALRPINAIYFNPNQAGTGDGIDRLIDIINTTAVNAVVIDIKEEIIYYDSQVSLFVDAGTVRPIMDLNEILQRFREHNIYTIARLVVFKDGLVAKANPDMAVLNNQTGDLWRDMNGVAWVNPMVHDLWRANTELAVEAAGYGFDEIQYDYVRFPTDGDLSTMDFGLENTQANRENSIQGFLEMSREALSPLGVKQSADVFGYTLIVDDDLGIGQNFAKMAQYVDYLSPMIYPSHWPEGALGLDGHPNDSPYETVEISMRKASEKLDGDMLRVRPWLQDFSFFDLMPYGDAEVRAQIQATEEAGASGWMLWDPNNNYHPGAIDPELPSATPNPENAADVPNRSTPVTTGRRRR